MDRGGVRRAARERALYTGDREIAIERSRWTTVISGRDRDIPPPPPPPHVAAVNENLDFFPRNANSVT
jgi:hypothetical protein